MRSFTPEQPMVRGYSAHCVELLEPLVYKDTERHLLVTVPQGLCSDGASVPAWCWAWLSASWVTLLRMGLLHDFLFRRSALIRDFGSERLVLSRRWCNTVGVESLTVPIRLAGESITVSESDQRKVWAGLVFGSRGSWHQKEIGWRPEIAA